MGTYQMLFSDLDGTLLSGVEQISEENRAAIREMTARGVHFVPSSGRTLHELPMAVRELPEVRYFLCSDGAVIYDKETNTFHTTGMNAALTARVRAVLEEYETNYSVRHRGHAYVDAARHTEEEYVYHRLSPAYRRFIAYYDEPVADFDTFCRSLDEVEMICAFFHDPQERAACKARLEATGDVLVVSSDPHNIEVICKDAGKGNGILRLADMLGIDRAATIAVGDTINDATAIAAAGLGLAMGNAVEELKAMADAVICRYDEHAMAYIAEHYI